MLSADAVDLAQLAGAETLMGIEAPDSLHQPLPPQDLVTTRDAAVEIIGDIEERAVAVGDAGIERQQVGRYCCLSPRRAAHFELLDRACGPHRPVAKQAATEPGSRGDAALAQVERQREVEQDVVVIAGIQRDAVEGASGGYPTEHVEGAVAVE